MSTITCTAVLLAEDPSQRAEGMAVGGFLAGYAGATRTSYATDLRIFSTWCGQADLSLLTVKRSHLELFGRWMEETGRMRSTVARRLSTLASFYRYCEQEQLIDRTRPLTCADRRSTTSPAPLASTATRWAPSSSRRASARLETTPWPRC
ncbi:MAG TPA: site-specific integrase [Acidimicrobiales bacterium]|nr:site-specific integrase [Acidimicrobiales bacterium]